MKKDSLDLLNRIAQIIFDKKGINILALDVRGLSTITDYLLIAEGGVDRHVIAIAKTIEEELKKIGEKPAYAEGMQTGDWIVLDYYQVMVHLFIPGLRERYQLEQLWSEAKIVDLNIVVAPENSGLYNTN